MLADVMNRDFVARQVDALRAHLAEPEDAKLRATLAAAHGVDAASVHAAREILRQNLPESHELAGQAGPAGAAHPALDERSFISRDPLTSLVQTAIEDGVRREHPEAVVQAGAAGAAPTDVVGAAKCLDFGSFEPEDPRWVTVIAEAVGERLLEGVHPFNPDPAEHEIASDARVILVGDWGTGLVRARAVSKLMAGEMAAALAEGRQAHVIHLGDVYYSGGKSEYDERMLAPGCWPVSAQDAAAGVTSWSLNGNHDMYSGGWAYFDHLLGEQRFSAQRSPNGKGTSFFRIKTGAWDIVALDTSWSTDRLTAGHDAVLQDPQAEWLAGVAAESDRKLMLLSHHQLFSVYSEGAGEVLKAKLAGPLGDGRIKAWIWGHEHRCMAFEPNLGVDFARCLGHGGVPVLSQPLDDPVPQPGRWEYRGFLDDDGQHWGRFGFAVLDFKDDEVAVRYINDLGEVDAEHSETIS